MLLSWLQNRWTSLCILFMALGTFILFLYGFFPLKYHSGKLSHMDDLPNFISGISIDGHEVYNSGENSVILMVIDGLRYDFVTEEYMPYTGQMLKNKEACIYVSVAEPPTVTMPRIKAMMTGSVSTFADVALNFGAPAVQGDSVLRAAASRGRRSVMYGDDTWLRLFPGLWAEHDGTTSFYVTDYTEVDNNVTRHLDDILLTDDKRKPTFDFLVLHYLGLDHIGHLEGAKSPKIKPKLLEMDEIVKKLVDGMKKWDRTGVVFVCGDHGMRDAGGHGGGTPAEVLVPLVVAKSDGFQCPHPVGPGPTIAQVDLAPTVSWLLNAPLPGDSTGRILPSLLPTDTRQHLYLLHVVAAHNAKQPAMPTDTEFYKQFQRAENQFAHYLATGQQSAAKIAKEFYDESLEAMSKYLAATNVNLDNFATITAIFSLLSTGLALLCVTFYSFQTDQIRKQHKHERSKAGVIIAFLVVYAIVSSAFVVICSLSETKSQFCSFDSLWIAVFLLTVCAYTTAYVMFKAALEHTKDLNIMHEFNAIDYLLMIGTFLHSFTFFGTSFIEEEHMTWYFFWNTLMLFVLLRTIVCLVMFSVKVITGATEIQDKPKNLNILMLPRWVFLIALHRYLRTMNQTGDRWLFLPDTADWLNAPENSIYLQAHLVVGTILTLLICLHNLRYTNNTMYMHTALTILSVVCILCYRVATKTLDLPSEDIQNWDPVQIVNVFWAAITIQFIIEILSYIGVFKLCGLKNKNNKKFEYNKPKAKTEDFVAIEEPLNLENVKLNLARSISHIMLNNLMLIIVLLMRPHNVIMVPSIYITCTFTSQCVNHKLVDTRPRNTDVVDIISQTLAHLWIGKVFFFYQGNSNTLASVDLGAGYVGLREYCPVRVAMRMGLHSYAGPALAGATLFSTLTLTNDWQKYLLSVWRATNIYATHVVYTDLVYCLVSFLFQHHLYVWTVFSPKLLYDFVFTVFTIQALSTIALIVGLTHITSWLARALTYKSRL